MARMHSWIGLAVLGFSLTGCVTQEKYNALKLERDRFAEQFAQAEANERSARAEADTLKRQLDAIMAAGGSQSALVNNLHQQIAEWNAKYADLNAKYLEALGRVGSGPLPEALSNELAEFVRANQDLVEFDSARGIVKFKSDVTFATGDATLTPKAREVIGRFATILNGRNASQYELVVAGHTDNTPVSNPATKQKGHHDNWYLSSHRAITVGSELQAQRVSPQRIGVIGYADQRPVASNANAAGKAQNRRVEVLILPTTVKGSVAGAPASTNLNKDTSATTDSNPALNK